MKLIEHLDSNKYENFKEVLIELSNDGVEVMLGDFKEALEFLEITGPEESMKISMDNDYISIKKENPIK